MEHSGHVTVRIFGLLRPICEERGQPTSTTIRIRQDGIAAREIARELGLPLELVEGVFVNHTVHGIDHVVRPGDEIAFVPYGTPGPHRVYLGLYQAGKEAPE